MDNTAIDVEHLRKDIESETEWRLRRKFLRAHYDKYDEERLICLSNVFVYVHCHGCRYPKVVMDEVAKLVEQIPDLTEPSYEERQKDSYKQQFVSASKRQ